MHFLSRAFLAVDTKRVRASARLLSVRFSLRTEVRPHFFRLYSDSYLTYVLDYCSSI